MASLDVENNRTILSVCAANSFGNSVHLGPTQIDPSSCVWHTLTLGAVETPVILEFVRERVRLLALRSQLQRHAALATDFAKTDAVRLFRSNLREVCYVALDSGMFRVLIGVRASTLIGALE